jgi:hypothetical protein
MTPREKRSGVIMNGKVTDFHSTVTKDTKIEGEHYCKERINVDKTELMNLQDDIKVLSSLLHAVTAPSKEVIQQKVNMILAKMASISEDSMSSEKYNSWWTEVKNGRSKTIKKQCDQFLIAVINKRYGVLENHEGYENVPHDRENLPTHDKKALGKKSSTRKVSKVIIMGDSHMWGMATELQHRLKDDFDVLGIVKPGSRIKELTNTLNSTISSFTKKDVCIIWAGSRDIAKDESENGLRYLKDFATRQNLTNLVVINTPHRHDLQESSCVNIVQ